MNGTMPNNGHDADGHVTAETLRRLIEEGAAREDDSVSPAADARLRPSDAALRDLAAALNTAAAAAPSSSESRVSREGAAVAAFRNACTERPPVPYRRRSSVLHGRLRRTRGVLLSVITVGVLGGGVAVAAAGGGVPFTDGTSDESRKASATASDTPSPSRSTPPSTPTHEDTTANRGAEVPASPDGTRPGEARGTEQPAGRASERALRSLCTARARNPHLVPRPLITAAGGREHIAAFCERLLAGPPPNDPGPPADKGSKGDEQKKDKKERKEKHPSHGSPQVG